MFDLPEHFPIGVTRDGQGPTTEEDGDYYQTVCWCGQGDECVWNRVLKMVRAETPLEEIES